MHGELNKTTAEQSRIGLSNPLSTNDIVWAHSRADPTITVAVRYGT